MDDYPEYPYFRPYVVEYEDGQRVAVNATDVADAVEAANAVLTVGSSTRTAPAVREVRQGRR